MPLAINGIGPVGAFGAGMAAFKAALTGDTKVTPKITRITTRSGDYDLPVFRADSKPLANFVKPRKLRRLDNFSRMALLGTVLAVEDSGMVLNGERTGLVVASAHGATATTFAFLDSVIEDGDALASPTLFSNSVHNAAASHIAEHFAITGPTLSLTQGADSLTMALVTAGQWLAGGQVDTVLCGVIDCYCNVLGYCWQSYREQNKNCKNQTSGPGEGALFLHLSRADQKNSPAKYGFLDKIEFNQERPPVNLPFICSAAIYPTRSNPESQMTKEIDKQRIKLNLPAVCGDLPVPAGFDLAAAATLLNDLQLYDHLNPDRTAAGVTPPISTIYCRQPRPGNRHSPATGNYFRITNHLI